MKALVVEKYRQPLRVAEVHEPCVGDRDVLIEVQAAGLNQLDEKMRSGEFKQIVPLEFPAALGHDVAGTVVQVGSEVTIIRSGRSRLRTGAGWPDRHVRPAHRRRRERSCADPRFALDGRSRISPARGPDRVAGARREGEGAAGAEGAHPRRRGRSGVDRDPTREAPRSHGGHHGERGQRRFRRGPSARTWSSTTAPPTSSSSSPATTSCSTASAART